MKILRNKVLCLKTSDNPTCYQYRIGQSSVHPGDTRGRPRETPTHPSISAGSTFACCNCRWLPSPQSTRYKASCTRTTVQLTLRSPVGMAEEVPSQVTFRSGEGRQQSSEPPVVPGLQHTLHRPPVTGVDSVCKWLAGSLVSGVPAAVWRARGASLMDLMPSLI